MREHLVLPLDDVDGLDVLHPLTPELGDDLVVDDVEARPERVFPKIGLDVLQVDVDEVRELHLHGAASLAEESILERVRLPFGRKAPLALVASLAVDVLVPELARVGSVLLSPRRHWMPSFPPKYLFSK